MAKKEEKTPPKDEEKKHAASEDAEHHDEEAEEGADEEDESEDEESDDEEEDAAADEDEDADDEDEDEDEDDEDDDEDDDHHASRGIVAPTQLMSEHGVDQDDPTWWLPHAVLGGLVLIGILGFLGVFTSTLGPPLQRLGILNAVDSAPPPVAPSAVSSAPKPAAPPPAPKAPPQPAQPPTQAPQQEQLGAKHLVVQYKGSERSSATRTKDEAKARADEALKKLKAKDGKNWDEIVGKYSDEPNAAERKGDLGRFSPNQMDPTFTAAVRKLKVGDMSPVIETPFGFHVIVRTL